MADETAEERRARAINMGWKPQEEYRGPPEKWRDFEEFLNVGETDLPVLRERLRKLDSRLIESDRKLDNMSKQLETTTTTLVEFRDYAATQEQRNYDKVKRELEAQMQQAVADGDPAAFNKARTELTEHEVAPPPKPTVRPGAADNPAKKGEQQQKPAEIPQAVKDFAERNPWYRNSMSMNSWAVGRHQEIFKEHPNLTIEENLQMIEDEARDVFPKAFENPRRREPAASGGADNAGRGGVGDVPRGQQRGRTLADLPPDARAAHDRFTKQMVKGKDGKMVPFITTEKFLADYQW